METSPDLGKLAGGSGISSGGARRTEQFSFGCPNLPVRLKATNLTDELGLTEGNPRAINDVQAGFDYYYARPILGRTISASLTLNF